MLNATALLLRFSILPLWLRANLGVFRKKDPQGVLFFSKLLDSLGENPPSPLPRIGDIRNE